MKRVVILVTFVALCFGVAAAQGNNPQIGTWKLNEAKSKFGPGANKNHTVVYEAAGDSIKVTVDGTDGEGNSTHNEWTGKFDGKSYAVTGDPTSDTRAYRKVGSRTLTFTAKKGAKVYPHRSRCHFRQRQDPHSNHDGN